MQKCQWFENPHTSNAPRVPTKGRKNKHLDDEEEDFDDDSEEELASKAAKAKEVKIAPAAVDANARSGDDFYRVGAYGKKTPKLAVLASLACSNSELIDKKIQEYAEGAL